MWLQFIILFEMYVHNQWPSQNFRWVEEERIIIKYLWNTSKVRGWLTIQLALITTFHFCSFFNTFFLHYQLYYPKTILLYIIFLRNVNRIHLRNEKVIYKYNSLELLCQDLKKSAIKKSEKSKKVSMTTT